MLKCLLFRQPSAVRLDSVRLVRVECCICSTFLIKKVLCATVALQFQQSFNFGISGFLKGHSSLPTVGGQRLLVWPKSD